MTKLRGIGESEHLAELDLENFSPYLMNRIMGRYNASLREEMSKLGLTTPQMRSLAVLSTIDGILIRELAVYAVVEQSTLSRALDALTKDSLIRREVDPNDSRAVRVFLTGKGRDVYEQLWPQMRASYDTMFAGIDREEKHAFVSTLKTLLRNIRKHNF